MIHPAVTRNAVILGAFAAATAAVLALTHEHTRERVACNRQAALESSLQQVFPEKRADHSLLEDVARVEDTPLGSGERNLYRARRDGEPAGLIMEATAPDGYGGPIDLLVGVDADGVITGVRVVPPHNETPGLGDKIETRKSEWILSFEGHSLDNTAPGEWGVRPDGGTFDAFTGATITPRAVTSAVHRALRFHDEHREELFALPGRAQTMEHCDE